MAGEVQNDTCKYGKTPASTIYLASLELEYLVLTISAGIIVAITCIIFFSETVFIYSRREKWPQPGKTIWLLGLYSVFAGTAFVGILVPRSGDLGAMIATMYLSTSLFVFKRLMVSYYGGKQKMIARLKNSEFTLRAPPCCCCCWCLPKLKVTARSSSLTEVLVLQFTILQPLLVFTEAVFIADMQENLDDNVTLLTSSIGIVSSMFALYGLFLLFRVSIQHLAYAGIKAKFVCLKLLVGIDSLQKLILSILASYEVIPCASGLNQKDNALRISRFLMILEAFFISILARIYYKRDQNLHLHPAYNQGSENSDETEPLVKSGSSGDQSEESSTLVGSVEPRYGTTTGFNTNGNNESLTIPSPIPQDKVQTEQPKVEA